MPRQGVGSNKDGKHYWLTPPELLKEIQNEFGFDFDACPYPRVPEFDGLSEPWGQSTYVNPPFAGPTAWVRKSISESEKGKQVVFVFPMPKWALMLLTHPNLKSVRNLKDVKWCAIEDGSPGKGIGQHIALFHLDGKIEKTDELIQSQLEMELHIAKNLIQDLRKERDTAVSERAKCYADYHKLEIERDAFKAQNKLLQDVNNQSEEFLGNRWREKYYDKIEELNKAEAALEAARRDLEICKEALEVIAQEGSFLEATEYEQIAIRCLARLESK